MSKRDFYAGVISALAVVDLHGMNTIYDEIVSLCNVDELIAHARREDEIEYSGLKKYIKRNGLSITPKQKEHRPRRVSV